MKQKLLIALMLIILGFSSCINKEQKTEDNLLYTAKSWTALTDQLGSTHTPKNMAIVDSTMNVNFTLKKKEQNEIVFIELICKPGYTLKQYTGVTITYKCDKELILKLSQSDFGKDGDNSYAHYQFIFPASNKYTTKQLDFSKFTQPNWTPDYAKGKELQLSNVDAIYLTPNVADSIGGSSALSIKKLVLH